MATTLKDALAQLKALGDEKVRARYRKSGAGDNQFRVPLGDIRKLAAKIKTNHQLAIALWDAGNLDARLLAILLLEPKELSRGELDTSRPGVASPILDAGRSPLGRPRRLEPDLGASRQESRRARSAGASGPGRV